MEVSWKYFLLLEAMAAVGMEGIKNWGVMDTLGVPWISLPESLRADLLTWRWLHGIVGRSKVEVPHGG